jgi:acyl-CoA reductase-like NAD-dependent aldehyde dehydrogenase
MGKFKAINFSAPYAMNINGKLVADAKETFQVFNPATNEVLANVPLATKDQLEEAVAGSKKAFKNWSALSWDERARHLKEFAEALDVHKDEFKTLLTQEQGKPRHSMADTCIEFTNQWIKDYALRRLKPEVIEETDSHIVEVHHVPLGVVGMIMPWNFPYLLALWQIAPCLLVGNACILKPSPNTPLTSLRFGEIAAQVFPAGVLNVLSGGNDFGAWMTEHPGIEKIAFTGSIATGKKIMAGCADRVKHLTLEMGGNDPAIVLPDADISAIVPTVCLAALGNSGQWCIAVKRIYVHSSIHAEFVKQFVAFAKKLKVGNGLDPSSDLGPIQNKMQYNKLINMMEDIKKNGYKIVLGGEIDQNLDGNFVPVTVVDNPPENSRIVKEEQFGPIVPIMAYDDVEDAIERANNTRFGLGASVWGKNRDQAVAVAKRLEAGTVWVNEIHIHGVDIPFGGVKESGFGVENGYVGLKAYCDSKTYMFKK